MPRTFESYINECYEKGRFKDVQITEKHIRVGIPGSQQCCAIALAIHDAGFSGAVVRGITWSPDAYAVGIPLPEVAITFIKVFDDFRCGSPFTLKLPLGLN